MNVHPDRAPPEIEPGVTVADLATVEACDHALDQLTMSITQIERQLKGTPRNSPNQPVGWRANAEAALRIKRFLMPRVQERRAEVKRSVRQCQSAAAVETARLARLSKDRALIAILAEIAPDALAQAGQLARIRYPELYATASAAEVL